MARAYEESYVLPLTKSLLHPTCRATERTIVKCISRDAGAGLRRHDLTKTRDPALVKGPQPKINMTDAYIKKCRVIFESYDRNGSGRIEDYELKYLLDDIGAHISAAELRAWLQRKQGHSTSVSFMQLVDGCQKWFGTDPTNVRLSLSRRQLQRNVSAPAIQSYEMLQRQAVEANAFDYKKKRNVPTDVYHIPTLAKSHSALLDTVKREYAEFKKQNQDYSESIHDGLHKAVLEKEIIRSVSQSNLHHQANATKRAVFREKRIENRNKKQGDMQRAQHFASSIGMLARHTQLGDERMRRVAGEDQKFNLVTQRKEAADFRRSCHQLLHQRRKNFEIRQARNMKHSVANELIRTQEQIQKQQEQSRQNREVFKISPYTCMVDRLDEATDGAEIPREELMIRRLGTRKPTGQSLDEFFADMKEPASKEEVRRVTVDANSDSIVEPVRQRLSRREVREIRQGAFRDIRSAKIKKYRDNKQRQKSYCDETDILEKAPRVKVDQEQELDRDFCGGTPSDWTVPPTTASLTTAFSEWVEREADISAFVPPPNSPPAALRHYGTMRSAPTPPFGSNVARS